MKTTVTIGGQVVDWDADWFQPGALTRHWGGPPDEFEFTAGRCGPLPPYPPGVEVVVTLSADDGSNPYTRFVGDTGRASSRQSAVGWTHAYSVAGLKARGDRVTITGPDGGPIAQYNLPTDDPMYQPGQAGRTVGQILTSLFQVPATVAQLRALGIGNYTQDGKLPSVTAADFAQLDAVPPRPVQLFGRGIFNQAEDLLAERHPRFGLWIDPATRAIRCRDLFALPARTLTLPTLTSYGSDPAVDGLAIDVDASECYSAVSITGTDVILMQRSLSTGGLVPAWSKVDEEGGGPNNDPPWTILDATTPKDSAAQGAASNVTSTSFTVSCDDPKQKWPAGYWSGVRGRAFLEMTNILPGVVASESAVITSNTALAPGGTSTITVDATTPFSSTQFDRFRLVGTASPRALVGKLYDVKGIPDGYSLFPMFPIPMPFEHMTGVDLIRTPRALIQWNGFHTGKPPFYEYGVGVQVDAENRRILLTQPAAQLSADPQVLQSRYPRSVADGLPSDIIAALPAFRGALSAYAPAGGGYSGIGFTQYGITRVWTLAVPEFTDKSQLAGYQKMAEERLAVYRDPVFSVSARQIDYPADFDPLADAYALQFVIPGCTTPIDGIPIPCRSTRLEWNPQGGVVHSVTYQCSNNRRAGGDDQYTHPAFGAVDYGLPTGYDSFTAGTPMMLGMQDPAASAFGAMERAASSAFGSMESAANNAFGSMGAAADSASAGFAAAADSARSSFATPGGLDDASAFDPSSVMDGWRPGHALKYEGPSRQERIDAIADRKRQQREQDAAAFAQSDPPTGPAIDPDAPIKRKRLTLRQIREQGGEA